VHSENEKTNRTEECGTDVHSENEKTNRRMRHGRLTGSRTRRIERFDGIQASQLGAHAPSQVAVGQKAKEHHLQLQGMKKVQLTITWWMDYMSANEQHCSCISYSGS
jgi:hypothetical protein